MSVSKQRLLIVEDAREYQLLLSMALASLEVELTIAETAAEAHRWISEIRFDLILLDISLPDQDGMSFCRQLQGQPSTAHIPVFFITGKTSTPEVVAGFALGAEDYISKPIEPLAFRARVEAKLKKLRAVRHHPEVLTQGGLQLRLSHAKAYLVQDERKVDLCLTPTEFKLLYHLMKDPEQILTRQQLLELVWGDDADVSTRTVDVHIFSLRRKLDTYASSVKSVSGKGYRFVHSASYRKAA